MTSAKVLFVALGVEFLVAALTQMFGLSLRLSVLLLFTLIGWGGWVVANSLVRKNGDRNGAKVS